MNIKGDCMGVMTVYGKVNNGTDHVITDIFPVFIHLINGKKVKDRTWNRKEIAELLPSLYLDELNNMESFTVKQGKKSTNANESP